MGTLKEDKEKTEPRDRFIVTLRPPATLCRWSQCRAFFKKRATYTTTPPSALLKGRGKKRIDADLQNV